MFICLGTVYSWSIFKTPLEKVYSIDASLSGLPYLVFLISYTVLMIVSGNLVDKYNPRVIVLVGGVLVGAGWLLSGLVHSFAGVVICYGFISGGGVGIAYGVPIKVVSNWFTKKKGLALGLLLSGFGLSPFVTAPIIKSIITSHGVNRAFISFGIAFLIIIPLIGLYFKNPKSSENDSEPDMPMIPFNKVLFSKKFIGLWMCFAIGTTVGLMVIGVTSQIGQEMFGVTSKSVALMISAFAVFNALGRPLFGYITDRYSPFKATLTSFFMILLSSIIMLIESLYSPVLFFTATAVLWMNLGAWLSIAPTSTGIFFTKRSYSRNYGMLFSAYGFGALLGTPLAGIIRTNLGSYKYMFIPAAFLCAIGIIVAYFMIRPKQNA